MINFSRIFSLSLMLQLAFQATNVIAQERAENPIITHMYTADLQRGFGMMVDCMYTLQLM